MKSFYQSFLILFLLTSCAGYKIRNSSNPLEKAGINSIAVPMFINKTTLQWITPNYTRKLVEVFSSYSNLNISVGNLNNEDAVVLGIIRPENLARRKNFVRDTSIMNEEQKSFIGKRNAFEVPITGEFEVVVDIIILKNPTQQEIEFLTDNFDFAAKNFPQTIFSHSFTIRENYSMENAVGDINSAAPLRGVQNRGKLRKKVVDSSEKFGQELREVISNAF